MARRGDFDLPDRLITPDMVDQLVVKMQEKQRKQIEDRPIKSNMTLKAALKKQPAAWIEGICLQHSVEGSKRAAERIRDLCRVLPERGTLQATWARLPEPARGMLRWLLLDKGGYATMQELAAKFGPDDDVSWWWNEGQVPRTPLGMLRVNGIAYVGTLKESNRRMRTAVVPVELREKLLEVCEPEEGPGEQSQAAEAEDESRVETAEDAAPSVEWIALEEFVQRTPFGPQTEELYKDLLSRIARNPKAFRPGPVRALVERILREGHEWARLAAYNLGVAAFGTPFAELALKDPSPQVRLFAKEMLESRSNR